MSLGHYGKSEPQCSNSIPATARAPISTRRRRRARRRRTARPDGSCRRRNSAESATPQSDSVATSGETTVTAAAVVRLEQADVREPEQRPGGHEAARAARSDRRRVASERSRRRRAAGGERRRRGERRLDASVSTASQRTRLSRTAKTIVAASAKTSPIARTCSGRARSPTSRIAADDDQDRAERRARAASGSSSKHERDRDGEERRRADDDRGARRARRRAPRSVNRSCESPGPSSPASRNGQTSRARAALHDARTAARLRARRRIVSSAPASASGAARQREPERDRHRAEQRGRGAARAGPRPRRATLPAVRIPAVIDPRVRAYADLLLDYSIGVQPGWQVLVATTTEALPLARELSRGLARRGAWALPRLVPRRPVPGRSRLDRGGAARAAGRAAAARARALAARRRFHLRARARPPGRSRRPRGGASAAAHAARAARPRPPRRDPVRPLRLPVRSVRGAGGAVARRVRGRSSTPPACATGTPRRSGCAPSAIGSRALGAPDRRPRDRSDAFSLDGRPGSSTTATCNVPGGEVFFSPVEESLEGAISSTCRPAARTAMSGSSSARGGRRGERGRGRRGCCRPRSRRTTARGGRRARDRLQRRHPQADAQRPLRREARRDDPPRARRRLPPARRPEPQRCSTGT